MSAAGMVGTASAVQLARLAPFCTEIAIGLPTSIVTVTTGRTVDFRVYVCAFKDGVFMQDIAGAVQGGLLLDTGALEVERAELQKRGLGDYPAFAHSASERGG